VILCATCNTSQGRRDLDDFLSDLRDEARARETVRLLEHLGKCARGCWPPHTRHAMEDTLTKPAAAARLLEEVRHAPFGRATDAQLHHAKLQFYYVTEEEEQRRRAEFEALIARMTSGTAPPGDARPAGRRAFLPLLGLS